MLSTFNDKVAVITGAGGGLGSALARKLAERGCNLALADISEAALEKVRASISAKVMVTTHVVNVSSKDAMTAFADTVEREHGAAHLLINNAGITYQKSFATHSIEDWENIVGINWWGVLYGCHYFLPALTKADGAHIVNLSSMSGTVGLPNQTSYCATKGAVKLLSESMWAEMEKLNIGVTSVHPGAIKTEMIQATLAESDDVEAASRNYDIAMRTGVTAEHAADKILGAVMKNKIRVRIGKDSIILDILKRLFPIALQKQLRRVA